METENLAYLLKRLYPEKSYTELKDIAIKCVLNFDAEIDKFIGLDSEIQDYIIDCLLVLTEER